MLKEHPGLDRSETLQKIQNYSNRRFNAQLYYREFPYDTPAFKRRVLMNNFGRYEGDKYLAETDVEEQKALHLRQVKAQKELLTTLEVNEQANEEEWLQDNREANEKMLRKDHVRGDDERELELFWNEREEGDIALWNNIF